MSTIAKAVNGKVRRHAAGENGKPLCGGGHGAKKAAYQGDLGDDVDCAPCLLLLAKRQRLHDLENEMAKFPWLRARKRSWTMSERPGSGDQFSIHFRGKHNERNFACALMLCDERLAQLVVDGLNSIYPPPRCRKRKSA